MYKIFFTAIAVFALSVSGNVSAESIKMQVESKAKTPIEAEIETKIETEVTPKLEKLSPKAPKSEYDFSWIKPIKAEHVCMVNNKFFTDPQIPVEVNGKTYYGCCEMCKGKLEASAELREATDPVSGNKVDKSSAIMGHGPDKSVYYFENEENMKKFDMQKKDN